MPKRLNAFQHHYKYIGEKVRIKRSNICRLAGKFALKFCFYIMFAMNYVRKNKHLLCCAYDSMGRDEMKRFFYTDFIGITQTAINNAEQQLGLNTEENFKKFLAHLYTEAIAGMLIDEFTDGEMHNPEKAVEYFSFFLKNSLPAALTSAEKDKTDLR